MSRTPLGIWPPKLIFFRVFEKLDDLDQFILRFVDPFDVSKTDPGGFLDIDLRLALADLHQAATGTATHAIEEKTPQHEEK